MTEDPKRLSGESGKEPEVGSLRIDEDTAIFDARCAIEEGLQGHLKSCLQVFGETALRRVDISEGLLISILKLIAPGGKYPMQSGRFWQILDRHGPFSPLDLEDSIREPLMNEIEALLAAAENESFEDGFDSVLSLELQRLVLQHDGVALEIVSDLICEDRAAPDVAREALACLGEMEDEQTHNGRRRVLERALACSSHVARDGAVTGLSDLRDPRSIPALEAAAEREDYRLLRTNMLELAGQLKGA
ncbi:MAG TPA: HEAT repeat domain-containing protein [Thermoguttaceae bacterium]|nr:HEAT repeat domain-containing protein [Thermoguttaceae bacterium]